MSNQKTIYTFNIDGDLERVDNNVLSVKYKDTVNNNFDKIKSLDIYKNDDVLKYILDSVYPVGSYLWSSINLHLEDESQNDDELLNDTKLLKKGKWERVTSHEDGEKEYPNPTFVSADDSSNVPEYGGVKEVILTQEQCGIKGVTISGVSGASSHTHGTGKTNCYFVVNTFIGDQDYVNAVWDNKKSNDIIARRLVFKNTSRSRAFIKSKFNLTGTPSAQYATYAEYNKGQKTDYDKVYLGDRTTIDDFVHTHDDIQLDNSPVDAHNNMQPYVFAYCWKRTE